LSCFTKPRKQLAMCKHKYQEQLMSRFREAETIKQLEVALQTAEDASEKAEFDVSPLDFYREKLHRLHQPFALHVTTLAGAEATVQVYRTDTVAIVREKVAKDLDLKAYRINLVCPTKTLEPDSATLEEFTLGSCEMEEVALFFGEVDRWKEMSIPEFLKLATSLKILSVDDANTDQQKFDSGKMSRLQVQTQWLITQIKRRELEEDAKRTREEDTRRKEEEAQRRAEAELHKAKQKLLAEVRHLIGCGSDSANVPLNDVEALVRAEDSASTQAALECLQQKATQASEDVRQATHAFQEAKHNISQLLDPVLPALEQSAKELKCLRKADIHEATAMKAPPVLIELTLKALCIMFDIHAQRKKSPDGMIVDDYWSSACRHLLGDASLLHKMFEFDKDNIREQIIRRLGPILENESFTPEHVAKVSLFCSVACRWIKAMVAYHHAVVDLGPRFKHLADRESDVGQLIYHQKVIEEVVSDLLASKGE